ncbi:nuclear transport factor 2 family protein [Streptomyces luteolus]|uniref:Nuclear transport factor 2 family protein n=1 Tax=Streptomyces luteolus TaxID=3043615 RepID=A0ABT6T433_9ACTN|nr:nuclear transport factor 2 family protein [Streptomyces sp. B-S-A12]MDI3422631.1 nuclear transport factor 2 family protein [Streptomyces sp. B-S-A12]
MNSSEKSLQANKDLVAEYIGLFYNDKDFDRARQLLTEDFVNHHHGVGTGRDRTVESFSGVAAAMPGFSLTVRRMVAEGDQVWTHSVARPAPDAQPAVVVDIWRIEDGRLAEHWDVGQGVPEDASLEELIEDAG